ncbi:MAG: NAD(P)H-dependent oxidoreductase [Bacillota bacterium]|nr:NAD(P)H-dependent oxidoreductase [Bacillota bacterium]
MNHLVVFAHPNPKSFCRGIVDTIEAAAVGQGQIVRVRNLYETGFEAILAPSDFEGFQRGVTPEDIKAEQELIKWADVITFVYPVWWAGMPAMLKGYVDRVLSYGFGYEYVNGAPNGLLKGKKALLFCTTGSPSDVYEQNGMHNSMKQVTDQGIFEFCGIQVVKHTFFGAVPYVPEETRKDYLKEVQRVVESIK